MELEAQPAFRVDLLREVATGPTSSVLVGYRQLSPRARQLWAVKVLRHLGGKDLEMLLRMRAEARDLAALGHRHLVCSTEVGLVGDHPALLAPWVDGVDLLDWIEVLRETGEELPGRVVCEILRATASALDAAGNRVPHGAAEPLGRVHRDVKPSNVMIDRDGELKVLDFGTGFTSLAGRHARSGALQKGLIKYLSPTRREGKRGGPDGDVYALGILGIELFRGRWLRRLRAQNPAHDRHLAEVVATLGNLGMRTAADDATLRSVLLRMVAFDPEARPLASEVANTFRTLVDRSQGACLESFAHAHALPWVEAVPDAADADVDGHHVDVVGDAVTFLDTQGPTRFPRPSLSAREPGATQWEETDEGWRVAGHLSEDLDLPSDEAPLPELLRATLPDEPEETIVLRRRGGRAHPVSLQEDDDLPQTTLPPAAAPPAPVEEDRPQPTLPPMPPPEITRTLTPTELVVVVVEDEATEEAPRAVVSAPAPVAVTEPEGALPSEAPAPRARGARSRGAVLLVGGLIAAIVGLGAAAALAAALWYGLA